MRPAARVAAGDLDSERLGVFAKQFSLDPLYADYTGMLAEPAVEAVAVSLPSFLHHPGTIAALHPGKHLFCEKPPTLDAAEIESIRACGPRGGLP